MRSKLEKATEQDKVRELLAGIVGERDKVNERIRFNDGGYKAGLEHEQATLNILLTRAGELGLVPADLNVWENGGF